jgi:hypothetical protein
MMILFDPVLAERGREPCEDGLLSELNNLPRRERESPLSSRHGEQGGRERGAGEGRGGLYIIRYSNAPSHWRSHRPGQGGREDGAKRSEGTILRTDRQPSLLIFHRIACH